MNKAACSRAVYETNYKKLHKWVYVELLSSWVIIIKKALSFIEMPRIFISSLETPIKYYLRLQK